MLFETIGMTPLIRLRHITAGGDCAPVLAKAEFLNPSGSIKDRPAKAMIMEGIRSGALSQEKTLLDSTSGNMGISYAMIGAILGYKVALCLPRNANRERKRILSALGAEIIETDPIMGFAGALAMAKSIHERSPGLYFYPDMSNNEENWRSHYNSTGLEIWEQSQGAVSHFVTGVGTAGTFTGVARRLKSLKPAVQTFVTQPNTPLHGLEGIRYRPSAISSAQSTVFDSSLVDGRIVVSTDEARDMTLKLARQEGLFVGLSSGAKVAAALKLAADLPPDNMVVTVLSDTGFGYFSDKLWDTPHNKF
jgi:cysteine synthase B